MNICPEQEEFLKKVLYIAHVIKSKKKNNRKRRKVWKENKNRATLSGIPSCPGCTLVLWNMAENEAVKAKVHQLRRGISLSRNNCCLKEERSSAKTLKKRNETLPFP